MNFITWSPFLTTACIRIDWNLSLSQVFQTPEPVSQPPPVAAAQTHLPQAAGQAPPQPPPVNTQPAPQTTPPTPVAPAAAAPAQVAQHLHLGIITSLLCWCRFAGYFLTENNMF